VTGHHIPENMNPKKYGTYVQHSHEPIMASFVQPATTNLSNYDSADYTPNLMLAPKG